MAKFKVGDKVRTRLGDGEIIQITAGTDIPYFVYGDNLRGHGSSRFPGKTGNHFQWFNECELKLIKREFIVIRRDGTKTIAELRHNREVIKSGTAVCNASDAFDFNTGAKLAFDRLMGRQNIDEAVKAWNKPSPAPEPPKFYTGKVFAEKSDDSLFTSRDGRIFEFVDGECVNSIPKDLMNCNIEFKTIDEIRKQYSSTIWHEVKSDV